MATCAEKNAKWQERVVEVEEDVVFPLVYFAPDVLYSCEGAVAYAPLNAMGYYLPEVHQGSQKVTGRGAVATTVQSYLEITGVGDYATLTLYGRRPSIPFVYDLDSDCRIGPLGLYNCGSVPRFTISPADGISVELILEPAAWATPADVDDAPPLVETAS